MNSAADSNVKYVMFSVLTSTVSSNVSVSSSLVMFKEKLTSTGSVISGIYKSTILALSVSIGTMLLANISLTNSSGNDRYVSLSLLATSLIFLIAFKSLMPISMNTTSESLGAVKLYG